MTEWLTPGVDPLLVWIPTACLALLLAHASLGKLLDRWLWLQQLSAYRLPDAALTPLGWLLPLAEGALALGLLSPLRPWAAAGAALLLLMYAIAMAWQLARGHRPDCGCGGAPLSVSPLLVLRNILLLPLAALAALPAQGRPLQAIDGAVLMAALLLATVLWSAAHQLLRAQQPPVPRPFGMAP